MSARTKGGNSARRRAYGLRLESLEPRDLLSVLPITWRGAAGGNRAAAASPVVVQTLATGAAGGSPTPVGQPTAHELARERFVGKIAAFYAAGPGRFTDQALSISLYGSGGSTAASHTNLQMIVFVPTDLANGTITGQAALTGRNIGSTGNSLAINLTGDPGSLVQGLPTHYTWVVGGTSGGIFANATGQGTLDVKFLPGGKLPQRAFRAGKAYVSIQGLVNVVGVYNDLAAPGNRPAHS